MKKLLFALSIIAMFVLVGCNPCEVGDLQERSGNNFGNQSGEN